MPARPTHAWISSTGHRLVALARGSTTSSGWLPSWLVLERGICSTSQPVGVFAQVGDLAGLGVDEHAVDDPEARFGDRRCHFRRWQGVCGGVDVFAIEVCPVVGGWGAVVAGVAGGPGGSPVGVFAESAVSGAHAVEEGWQGLPTLPGLRQEIGSRSGEWPPSARARLQIGISCRAPRQGSCARYAALRAAPA